MYKKELLKLIGLSNFPWDFRGFGTCYTHAQSVWCLEKQVEMKRLICSIWFSYTCVLINYINIIQLAKNDSLTYLVDVFIN